VTGHYEAVRILFDTEITNYTTVLKRFFEIHDPTQNNGQGPDIGQQYQSAVFYYNHAQMDVAKQLLQSLHQKGYLIATKLLEAQPFWPAEDDHQQYYVKNNKKPYCHQPVSRFD
jgi:peptide methionine sulfoxide reductase msrA/msrB